MGANSKIAFQTESTIPLELSIAEYIKLNCPGYISDHTCVSTDFIRLVEEAMNRVVAGSELLRGVACVKAMTREEVAAILRKLPGEVIAQPLTFETIYLILDEYSDLIYRGFIEETARNHCVRACEFNNRANAEKKLGRYLEAQRDYNRACDMEPNEAAYFLNRSALLLELGMATEALADAIHAYKTMRKAGIEHNDDYLQLASIVVSNK
jgi:tetratricopeptide (TPR) repeat protein